jgi:hypothetical protein
MLLALLRGVFVVVAMSACTSAPPAPTFNAPAATADPSTAPDPAIAEWIKFRTAVGLRADEAWVREVAGNPASRGGSDTYEIPLLPSEVAFLLDRNRRIEDAHAFGASYGAAFPDGFAGEARSRTVLPEKRSTLTTATGWCCCTRRTSSCISSA